MKFWVAMLIAFLFIILLFAITSDYLEKRDKEIPHVDLDVDVNFTIDNMTAGDYIRENIPVGIGERNGTKD